MQKWARRNPKLRRILGGLKARKEAQNRAIDVSDLAVQADQTPKVEGSLWESRREK